MLQCPIHSMNIDWSRCFAVHWQVWIHYRCQHECLHSDIHSSANTEWERQPQDQPVRRMDILSKSTHLGQPTLDEKLNFLHAVAEVLSYICHIEDRVKCHALAGNVHGIWLYISHVIHTWNTSFLPVQLLWHCHALFSGLHAGNSTRHHCRGTSFHRSLSCGHHGAWRTFGAEGTQLYWALVQVVC